jgi:hypothetical protein
MPLLLIDTKEPFGEATVGGRPLASADTKWPLCKTCGNHLQFLAQLPLEGVTEVPEHRDQVLLLFYCNSQPGLCDEWEPNLGGNAAILVNAKGRIPLQIPDGKTLLPVENRVKYVQYQEGENGETPDDQYCRELDAHESKVLGKLGGEPLWIQANETPNCMCGSQMTFVAQLDERGGGGINFGGGNGYSFVCKVCIGQATFLSQC